jgi:hypothetical protein
VSSPVHPVPASCCAVFGTCYLWSLTLATTGTWTLCSLAMVAFVGFTIQAQALGKGPIASLQDHLSSPFGSNLMTNLGKCVIPESVNASGVTIPLFCLWPQ